MNFEYHKHDSEWITENHPLTIHKLLSIFKYVLHLCHILMLARCDGGDRERGDSGQPGLVPQAAGAATDIKVQRK